MFIMHKTKNYFVSLFKNMFNVRLLAHLDLKLPHGTTKLQKKPNQNSLVRIFVNQGRIIWEFKSKWIITSHFLVSLLLNSHIFPKSANVQTKTWHTSLINFKLFLYMTWCLFFWRYTSFSITDIKSINFYILKSLIYFYYCLKKVFVDIFVKDRKV